MLYGKEKLHVTVEVNRFLGVTLACLDFEELVVLLQNYPGSMQPVVFALLASTVIIVFAFAYPGRNIALKVATECPMASSTAAATAEHTTIFRRPRNISAVPNAGHGRLPCASIFPIHIRQQIPTNTLLHSFLFSIHLCMQVGNTHILYSSPERF